MAKTDQPIEHPMIWFSNAISTRGRIRRCYRTTERADQDAAEYRPFNNTRIHRSVCSCPEMSQIIADHPAT